MNSAPMRIIRNHGGAATSLTRGADETEQDLIDRATQEVKRSALGVAFLQAADTESAHADH
jgi:hypothetical protein